MRHQEAGCKLLLFALLSTHLSSGLSFSVLKTPKTDFQSRLADSCDVVSVVQSSLGVDESSDPGMTTVSLLETVEVTFNSLGQTLCLDLVTESNYTERHKLKLTSGGWSLVTAMKYYTSDWESSFDSKVHCSHAGGCPDNCNWEWADWTADFAIAKGSNPVVVKTMCSLAGSGWEEGCFFATSTCVYSLLQITQKGSSQAVSRIIGYKAVAELSDADQKLGLKTKLLKDIPNVVLPNLDELVVLQENGKAVITEGCTDRYCEGAVGSLQCLSLNPDGSLNQCLFNLERVVVTNQDQKNVVSMPTKPLKNVKIDLVPKGDLLFLPFTDLTAVSFILEFEGGRRMKMARNRVQVTGEASVQGCCNCETGATLTVSCKSDTRTTILFIHSLEDKMFMKSNEVLCSTVGSDNQIGVFAPCEKEFTLVYQDLDGNHELRVTKIDLHEAPDRLPEDTSYTPVVDHPSADAWYEGLGEWFSGVFSWKNSIVAILQILVIAVVCFLVAKYSIACWKLRSRVVKKEASIVELETIKEEPVFASQGLKEKLLKKAIQVKVCEREELTCPLRVGMSKSEYNFLLSNPVYSSLAELGLISYGKRGFTFEALQDDPYPIGAVFLLDNVRDGKKALSTILKTRARLMAVK